MTRSPMTTDSFCLAPFDFRRNLQPCALQHPHVATGVCYQAVWLEEEGRRRGEGGEKKGRRRGEGGEREGRRREEGGEKEGRRRRGGGEKEVVYACASAAVA